MAKKALLAGLAVFVAWEILDFIIHGMLLMPYYSAQPALWRPEGEMKLGVMLVATLIAALAFAALYAFFVRPKALASAVKFGLVWGIGGGVAMGYGTYASMPIPYYLALGWFLATVVEACVAGALVGVIVKE